MAMKNGSVQPALDKNGIGILIVLLDRGSTNLSGLEDVVSNLTTRKTAVENLRKLDLVTFEPVREPRLCFRIALTEHGKVIAALQKIANDCISGSFDVESAQIDS